MKKIIILSMIIALTSVFAVKNYANNVKEQPTTVSVEFKDYPALNFTVGLPIVKAVWAVVPSNIKEAVTKAYVQYDFQNGVKDGVYEGVKVSHKGSTLVFEYQGNKIIIHNFKTSDWNELLNL